jgi:hypothetical protein
MKYKTNYKKPKKYATGGYGIDYSYRDNILQTNIQNELQLNKDKNQYYTKLANEQYLANTNALNENYQAGITDAHLQAGENRKKQALYKNITQSLLAKKGKSGTTYNKQLNDYITKQFGLDAGTIDVQGGRDLAGGYDPTQTTPGDPGGIGQTATDQSLLDAEYRYRESQGLPHEELAINASGAVVPAASMPSLVERSWSAGTPLATSGTTAGTTAAAGTTATQATSQGAATISGATGSMPGEVATKINPMGMGKPVYDNAGKLMGYGQAGQKALEQAGGEIAETVGGEVVETVGGEVAETAVSEGAEAAGTAAAGTVAKAPVQGGLWTAAADIGLHYLSDDKDPSTYTAGEVATDIGSLALDIVTYDWVGAAMQLYDIGSQWAQRNKLKKEQKRLEARRKQGIDTVDKKWDEDYNKAKQYVGYGYHQTGKRSGFGRGELGGYSKYI